MKLLKHSTTTLSKKTATHRWMEGGWGKGPHLNTPKCVTLGIVSHGSPQIDGALVRCQLANRYVKYWWSSVQLFAGEANCLWISRVRLDFRWTLHNCLRVRPNFRWT